MQKIVILGGCGYIGSELFLYLQKNKYDVDTVDLEWFGNYINPQNIKLNYKYLSKSFFDAYDVVILLAGHSTVGMCEKDLKGSLKNNIENFVSLMQKLKKQKFIYASTYRLYGGVKKKFADELDSYKDPLSIYDLTKKTIDHYISFSDLEFYSLRMGTVNGYSPNLRVNQIINKLFLRAKNSEKIAIFDPQNPFTILGIEDLCFAIANIIKGDDKRGIYNIGSYNTTIDQILKELVAMFPKVEIEIEHGANKTQHVCIDTTKFSNAYNFSFTQTTKSILTTLKENVSANTHYLKSI